MQIDLDLVLIIGAPRSGTKMIRELLKLHPLIGGDLYESDRVWCYKNYDKLGKAIYANDVLPEVKKFIRQHFYKKRSKIGTKKFVDKNVMNTMLIATSLNH